MKHSIFTLLASTCLLTACVVPGDVRKQTVVVETPLLVGAECRLFDNRGNKWWVEETPAVVTVKNGYGPITIQCEKEGYKRAITQIRERYPHEQPLKEYQYMVSSSVSLLDDVSNDVGKRYPDVLVVLMEPEQFHDKQEKIDWLTAKHSYERMYMEPSRSDKELKQVVRNVREQMDDRKEEERAENDREMTGEDFIVRNSKLKDTMNRVVQGVERNKLLKQELKDQLVKSKGAHQDDVIVEDLGDGPLPIAEPPLGIAPMMKGKNLGILSEIPDGSPTSVLNRTPFYHPNPAEYKNKKAEKPSTQAKSAEPAQKEEAVKEE